MIDLLPRNNCEVHLWKYRLDNSSVDISRATTILSQEEKARAKRFISEEDRIRYLAVHLFLREILGAYLGLLPDEVQFVNGPNGKPFLKSEQLPRSIGFNLSYRDNRALLGISNTDYIGVDIERIRDIDHIPAFVINYFVPEEQQKILREETKVKQQALLYTFWTMKEALVKSLGVGLSRPLSKYNLCPFLDKLCRVPDFDPPNLWCIGTVCIAKHYKAAYAVRSGYKKVNVRVYEK